MSGLNATAAQQIIKRGSIKDEDVLAWRRAFYDDGVISPEEAETLFAIHKAAPVQDPSWAEFFVEAITDFLVRQAEPEGYVTDENARWLIDQVGKNGRVESKTEIELLVNVLDCSRWSPVSLAKFALGQIRDAVVLGDGPLRSGASDASKGTILDSEVELLRRVIYAFGGDGNIAVTKPEAEVLFEINDAVSESGLNEAWTELFVKAIANVVMASSFYTPPSREEALRSDAWVESRGELSPTGLVGAIVSSGLSGIFSAYRQQTPEERALARLERQRLEIITNEQIDADEADWLVERMERDGALSPAEDALLAFLSAEHAELHPSLQGLVDRHGMAA